MEKEVRVIPASNFELRKAEAGNSIEGYAAVFDKWSEDLGGFREKIAPGAFKNALKKSDVRYLIDHIPHMIVGRQGKNLDVKEDEAGLYTRLTRPKRNSQRFDQLEADIENGLIDTMSFAFKVKTDKWSEDKNGAITRTIKEFDEVFDASATTYAAYPDTSVAVRSMQEWRNNNPSNPAGGDPPTAQAAASEAILNDVKTLTDQVAILTKRIQLIEKGEI